MSEVTARMKVLVAGALPAILLLLAACGSAANEAPQSADIDADGIPIARVAARYTTALAADLDTLVASTDTAFVGEVVGTNGQRHLTFADTNRGIPITTYLVRVDESNGDPAAGSTVEVEQFGGVIQTSDGNDVRVVLDLDSPMYAGDTYLFIANEDGGTFTASAFARFPIQNGRVAAPAAWEQSGASVALAGATVDEAMEKVAASDR
jgi:hypothetical protein